MSLRSRPLGEKMSLFDISRKHNCMKTWDRFKYSWAFCNEIYPRYFGPIQSEVTTLLEIGVHAGGSLRMWEEYFPKAHVYGIDVVDCFQDEGRIIFRQGNQSDVAFLEGLSDEVGEWDIVIDDGLHRFPNQKVSFETLWPRIKKGGYYVIEDVGDRHPRSIPCFDYFADLAKRELGKLTKDVETDTHTDIKRIVFYPKMIILEKS